MPVQVDQARFGQMVDEALDTLPPQFVRMMRNVVVQVEDGEDPDLLGLYEGVPLTERLSDYSAMLPDQITVYRLAILACCDTEEQVVDEVRITVVHEIGHHVGIEDDRLHELGY